MARKRKSALHADPSSRARVPGEEKIARLLGLLLVKEMKVTTDKVTLLRTAGFEVAEVAQMLRTTENHVRVADHHGRKKKAK